VPNFGEAVTFAAGFGGTVGVDVVDGTDDVGGRGTGLELPAGTLVDGAVADDGAVGTVTETVGAAVDETD
jgi:hypothetical protein